MIASFFRDNFIVIGIFQAMQLVIGALQYENKSLEVEVANLNEKIQKYQLQVVALESSNTVLEATIADNNARIDQQNKIQNDLALKGQQAAVLAAENTKQLGSQISQLKVKLPQGDTECERVFSLLQDL